jgi:AcrR family transcriptional regulator
MYAAMNKLRNTETKATGEKYLDKGSRKPRDERWAQILDVAAQEFFERGYDATSLQAIANRTGILKGSIYYYIKTKEDLLGSLLQEAQQKGLRTIRPIVEGPGNAIERLAAMIRCHVDFVCTDRARTAVFLHERQRLSEEKRKECLGDEHAYPQLFQRVIVEGQKAALIRPELNPQLTALCLIGSLNSLYEWFQPTGKFSVATIGEHYVAVSLSGMTTPDGFSSLVGRTKRRASPMRGARITGRRSG